MTIGSATVVEAEAKAAECAPDCHLDGLEWTLSAATVSALVGLCLLVGALVRLAS